MNPADHIQLLETTLEPLLAPRSIAVVGASPDPSAIGGAPLANLRRFGYDGEIHLVSRSRSEIDGLATVGSVAELPEGIDTAILAVPGAVASQILEECGQRGVRSAVLFSAGFAELGDDGRLAQEELTAIARRHGMAVAGPNCLGLVNFVDGIPLTFAMTERVSPAGSPAIGIIAQSGAMTMGLTYAAQAAGLPVSYAISTGNEAVVGLEDYLEFLLEDPHTTVIGLLAEQIRQVPRLRTLARRAVELDKPIVLLQLGRSSAGRAAAATHTGALAGDYAQIHTVLRADGVIIVESLDELVDVAQALARHPQPPTALGSAVLTDSGAVKTLTIDQAEAAGVPLAEIGEQTVTRLTTEMPAFATATNPADITAQALNDPSLYTKAVEALLTDDNVAMLAVANMIGSEQQTLEQVEAIIAGLDAKPVPTWYVLLGGDRPVPESALAKVREARLPLLRSTDRALRAMRHVGSWIRDREDLARLVATDTLHPVDLSGGSAPATVLSEHASKRELRSWGIAVPDGALVASADDAVELATRLGFPVVVKGQLRGTTHKSELGMVRLGLADADAVRGAVAEIEAAASGLALEGVLVEQMAGTGVELILGAQRDAEWGTTLLVGLGGVTAEALRDVKMLPADIDAVMAKRAIRSLRGAALLEGFRGRPVADVDAAADVLVRISRQLAADPSIVGLDINPLLLREHGVVALDATIVRASPEHSGDH